MTDQLASSIAVRDSGPGLLERVILCLLFLLPATGLDFLLRTWQTSTLAESQNEVREQAVELMTNFDRHLQPERICSNTLQRFFQRRQHLELTPVVAQGLHESFARHFP
nr:hypothetical protein [Candidatus Ozemobacteraceae bacterium]